MSFLDVNEDAARGTITLTVRVQPRASKDEITGALEGALRVRLCAPAVENRANEVLIEFLAGLLKIAKSAVRIQSGEHSRIKRVEIRGVSKQQVLSLLQQDA
jgi:uncharacterized protein (TIGR00251 family)